MAGKKAKAEKERRLDWMTDDDVLFWLEKTAMYAAEAMDEARRRGLLTNTRARGAKPEAEPPQTT